MPDPAPTAFLRKQWTSPTDIFSVLLIIGRDVVQLALISLAAGGFTPLTFSFGWVAYSISAISENRLVQCAPEISLLVINLKSGYTRPNNSWVLARLLKTYEYWMPADVRQKTENYLAFRRLSDQESDIPPP